MKKFFSGLIVGSIITTSISALAGGVWDKIDVLKNDINIMVNGKQIFSDNFLYNDTTYLPLRTIAEELGQKVTYDEATNTAHIGSVPENNVVAGGSVSNPLWIEKDGKRYTNDEFQLEIKQITTDIKPQDCILAFGEIDTKANEIIGKNFKYYANATGVYDFKTRECVLKYNGGINDPEHVSLDCYYSVIQPWLRSLK